MPRHKQKQNDNAKKNLKLHDALRGIADNYDLFFYIFKELMPSVEVSVAAIMDLFSWSLGPSWEDGHVKATSATIGTWLGGQVGFQRQSMPGTKKRQSVVELFATEIRLKDFKEWEAVDPRPSAETRVRVGNVIIAAIESKLILPPRGRKLPTANAKPLRTKTTATPVMDELSIWFRSEPLNNSAYAVFGRGIPYFSRQDFEVERNEKSLGSQSEFEKFGDFLADDEKMVFFISGRGGVGKTRLAEVLVGSLDRAEWGVYYLSPAVTRHQISKFLATVKTGKRYCLLLDYAEESDSALELIHQMHERTSDGQMEGATLKVVATCRSSAIAAIDRQLWRYQHCKEELNLDRLNKRDANRYVGWVVEKILRMHFENDWMDYLSMCGDTPSIAVFFSALKRRQAQYLVVGDLKRAESLAEALANPSGHKDFQTWIDRQLSKSFVSDLKERGSGLRENALRLAKIYTILPQKHGAFQDKHFADRLIDDGWLHIAMEKGRPDIEGSQDAFLYAPHDTFTEAIVQSWVKSYKTDREILELTADAYTLIAEIGESNRLASFLKTLNKCDLEGEYETAIAKSLHQYICGETLDDPPLRREAIISGSIVAVLSARIASPRLKIDALRRVNSLPNSALYSVASFAAEMAAAESTLADETFDLTRELATQVIARDGPNAKRLLRVFEIYPALVQDVVEEKLATDLAPGVTARLFSRWIREGLPVAKIKGLLDRWLRSFGTTRGAAHVMIDLLRAEEATILLDPHIEAWLSAVRGGCPNSENIVAGPLLLERFKNGGDVRKFDKHLREWIAANRASTWAAQLVRYLEVIDTQEDRSLRNAVAHHALSQVNLHIGSVEDINSRIVKYLKVACNWDNNSDAAKIVARWAELEELSLSSSAQRVFSVWLEKGGSSLLIGTAVSRYLDDQSFVNGTNLLNAGWSLFFKNLIKFSDDPAYIIPFAERWIKNVDFFSFFEGQDFLGEWIRNAKLPFEPVAQAVWSWFRNPEHFIQTRSRHLIDSIAAYRPEVVDDEHRSTFQEAADVCLKAMDSKEDVYWLISGLLQMKLDFHYDDNIMQWLNEFGGREASDRKVSRLLLAWLRAMPANANLKWYLVAYFRRRIYGTQVKDDDLLFNCWKSVQLPFLNELVEALHFRLENSKDQAVAARITVRLREIEEQPSYLMAYAKTSAKSLMFDPSQQDLLVQCFNEIVTIDSQDPWIGSFIEEWLPSALRQPSSQKFNLICRWREIGRNPSELLPFFVSASDLRLLDSQIGRALATWISYLKETNFEPLPNEWIEEWIEYNFSSKSWSIGTFLLGLNEYHPAFGSFDHIAEKWLELYRDPDRWPRNHRSFFARVLNIYCETIHNTRFKLWILEDIRNNMRFPKAELDSISASGAYEDTSKIY